MGYQLRAALHKLVCDYVMIPCGLWATALLSFSNCTQSTLRPLKFLAHQSLITNFKEYDCYSASTLQFIFIFSVETYFIFRNIFFLDQHLTLTSQFLPLTSSCLVLSSQHSSTHHPRKQNFISDGFLNAKLKHRFELI